MREAQDIIRDLRARGWTLTALGLELDVPLRTVEDWHAGRRRPRYSGVKRDLEALLDQEPPGPRSARVA